MDDPYESGCVFMLFTFESEEKATHAENENGRIKNCTTTQK